VKGLPALVLVSGPAGAGKSTMARMISSRHRVACLDYDSLGQSFLESIHRRCCPDERYEAFYSAWRRETYDTLWRVAADNLLAGAPLVASAPCTMEWRDPRFFAGLRAKYSADFLAISIELLPDAQSLRERLLGRAEARDAGKLADWARFAQSLPQPAVWDADHRFLLEGCPEDRDSNPFDALLDAALHNQERGGAE